MADSVFPGVSHQDTLWLHTYVPDRKGVVWHPLTLSAKSDVCETYISDRTRSQSSGQGPKCLLPSHCFTKPSGSREVHRITWVPICFQSQ